MIPGDANQDQRFDQTDLVRVPQAGESLTARDANWGEGDWDGAPGGHSGSPPPGDGVFDPRDIVAAIAHENYVEQPRATFARMEVEELMSTANRTEFGVADRSMHLSKTSIVSDNQDTTLIDVESAHGNYENAVELIDVPERHALVLTLVGFVVLFANRINLERAELFRMVLLAYAGFVIANIGRNECIWAVVLADGEASTNTTAPLDDPGWENVGQYGEFSATYLGNRWVITADHVVAVPTVTFGSVAYTIQDHATLSLENAEGAMFNDELLTSSNDLRLFRLEEEPPLPSLTILEEPAPLGSEVIYIGHGRDRLPDQLYWQIEIVDNDAIWEEVDTLVDFSGFRLAETRTKRWGTDAVVADGKAGFAETDTLSLIGQFDPLDFELNGDLRQLDTPFEAAATNGDSGGAVFYKDESDQWNLAGVLLSAGIHPGQPLDTVAFGNLSLMADLTKYRKQIVDVITGELLFPGDANQDTVFNQLDLVQVLQAAKYLSGEAATWGEGDWNSAPTPGGRVGQPPVGDGLFNQMDIVAALANGNYQPNVLAALNRLPPTETVDGIASATMLSDLTVVTGVDPMQGESAPIVAVHVPEPATLAMALFGVTGLVLVMTIRRSSRRYSRMRRH